MDIYIETYPVSIRAIFSDPDATTNPPAVCIRLYRFALCVSWHAVHFASDSASFVHLRWQLHLPVGRYVSNAAEHIHTSAQLC